MAESLTQQDRDALEALLNSGDHTGYYVLYRELTGSADALLVAQISSFSGVAGGAAVTGNVYAKWLDAMAGEGVYSNRKWDRHRAPLRNTPNNKPTPRRKKRNRKVAGPRWGNKS